VRTKAIGLARPDRYIVRALFRGRTVAVDKARGFFGLAFVAMALGAKLGDAGKRVDRWEYWLCKRRSCACVAADDVKGARP
jgi:hypothetical protein